MGYLIFFGLGIWYAMYGYIIHWMAYMFPGAMQHVMSTSITIGLIAFYIWYRKLGFMLSKDAMWKLFRIGLIGGVQGAAFVLAVLEIPSAYVVMLLYAGTLTTGPLFGRYINNDTLSWSSIVGVSICLAGLAIFLSGIDLTASLVGVGWGLVAGVGFALMSAYRRKLTKEEGRMISTSVMNFWTIVWSVIPSSIIVLLGGDWEILSWNWGSILALLVMGAGVVMTGYLQFVGFARVPTHIGLMILTTEIFFALIFYMYLLQEIPTRQDWIAGAIIFLGAAWASWMERKA